MSAPQPHLWSHAGINSGESLLGVHGTFCMTWDLPPLQILRSMKIPGQFTGVHFVEYGTLHKARWMAKVICCIKILLLRDQFPLTRQEETGHQRFLNFTIPLLWPRLVHRSKRNRSSSVQSRLQELPGEVCWFGQRVIEDSCINLQSSPLVPFWTSGGLCQMVQAVKAMGADGEEPSKKCMLTW